MKKTLSTFALGLALTFGASAIAPAANAAVDPAPVSVVQAAGATVTMPSTGAEIPIPATRAEIDELFDTLDLDLAALSQKTFTTITILKTSPEKADTFDADIAAEKAAYAAKVVERAKTSAALLTDYNNAKALVEKKVTAERAAYAAKLAAYTKAVAKVNATYDAKKAAYTRDFPKATTAKRVTMKANLIAAAAFATSERARLKTAFAKESPASIARVAALRATTPALKDKYLAKVGALKVEIAKDKPASDARIAALTKAHNTSASESQSRISRLLRDLHNAEDKYDSDYEALSTAWWAAKA